jgi:nucleotide-binding universal stress UspA family protein
MSEWIVMGLRTLDGLAEDARSRATKAFAGTGIRWDFQVRAGQPGQEILRAVEELDADLIVIGSNCHSTFHNYLVGSTTAYVTAHAHVPVVVVRLPAPHRARRPRRDTAGRPALTVLPT